MVEATHHVYYYYALNESHTLPYQIPGRIARPHPPLGRIWHSGRVSMNMAWHPDSPAPHQYIIGDCLVLTASLSGFFSAIAASHTAKTSISQRFFLKGSSSSSSRARVIPGKSLVIRRYYRFRNRVVEDQ